MKIDLNNVSTALFSAGMAKKDKLERNSASPSDLTGDRATLSSEGSTVPELVLKALKVPEVRQEKVNALRAAVSSGTYSVDPAKIAEAIIDSES